MKELELNDISHISIYLIDKNGNGYVGNIDTGFISILAQLTTFYPVDNIQQIPISDIIKK